MVARAPRRIEVFTDKRQAASRFYQYLKERVHRSIGDFSEFVVTQQNMIPKRMSEMREKKSLSVISEQSGINIHVGVFEQPAVTIMH